LDKIEDKKLSRYLKSKNGDLTLNLTSPLPNLRAKNTIENNLKFTDAKVVQLKLDK